MSKTVAKYRQFTIDTKDDALLALGSLISSSISILKKFEVYATEAKALQQRYLGEEYIPSKDYEDVHDKVLYCQHVLLTLMADEANDIFSYRSLRKWLTSHDVEGCKIITRTLDTESLEILNELHEIRNWTLHNTQSRLVAEKEVMERQAAEMERVLGVRPSVIAQLNPIVVVEFKSYTMSMLESFVYHNLTRFAQFKIILDEMKRDYQDIFDLLDNPSIVVNPEFETLVEDGASKFPVKIATHTTICGITDKESDVANLSMAIQKRKYDGSNDSFNKHTGKEEKN